MWRVSIGGGGGGAFGNVVDQKTHGPPPPLGTKMALNRAFHRNHHFFPAIDGVSSLLSNGHGLTVLDAKNGFWYIQFDEPSSLATTFVTP